MKLIEPFSPSSDKPTESEDAVFNALYSRNTVINAVFNAVLLFRDTYYYTCILKVVLKAVLQWLHTADDAGLWLICTAHERSSCYTLKH